MRQTINLNKIVLLGVMTMLIATPSCKKSFLDVPPQGQVPNQQFWQSESDATKAVNAMYGNLREWKQVAFAAIAIESLGSDDTEKGSDPSDATFLNKFDNFTATSTEGQILDFWTGQYQEVNLANQVLDNIPAINMDGTLKARYVGEAKFLRAYAYFRLVRAFGDVPLRLHVPKDATEYNIPRTPKAQVYTAIEQDLTDAAAVLPATYPVKDIGHATKGAALALHAKVAMYEKKWSDVLNYTNQVISSGVYSLFPNYEQLFRIANENNQESVFEIQATYVPGNCDASNSQYSQVQGVRSVNRGGWGFNVPTSDLANSYEANDPRKDATIIFRGETTPEGDAIPSTVPNPMYNQKSYVPFTDPTNQNCNEGSEQNIRVIRYADVLLMNAEAANETGNQTLAKQSLNAVRARARGGNNAILPDITSTDQASLRLAIWEERHHELAMEFDRYFDVIRQGRAAQIFQPKGWTEKYTVWPIPQNEIDLSAGVLTQNPGF
ncbi:MAG: RagB/SusD family nutrient uptake outer membrane protein [Flavisolibacter sp.]